jgi:hypothetical protein
MSDYRSYYEEEEPSPRPRGRWLGGLILGIILGGIIGFVVGSGMNGDIGRIVENPGLGSAEGGISILVVIIVIAVVALKSMRLTAGGRGDAQNTLMRLALMLLALFLALGFGVFFFLGH